MNKRLIMKEYRKLKLPNKICRNNKWSIREWKKSKLLLQNRFNKMYLPLSVVKIWDLLISFQNKFKINTSLLGAYFYRRVIDIIITKIYFRMMHILSRECLVDPSLLKLKNLQPLLESIYMAMVFYKKTMASF